MDQYPKHNITILQVPCFHGIPKADGKKHVLRKFQKSNNVRANLTSENLTFQKKGTTAKKKRGGGLVFGLSLDGIL